MLFSLQLRDFPCFSETLKGLKRSRSARKIMFSKENYGFSLLGILSRGIYEIAGFCYLLTTD